MTQFLRGFCEWIWDLIYRFYSTIDYYSAISTSTASSIQLNVTNYNSFLDKPLISGDLINITMTFRELLLYLVPILLIALAIYLFIKFAFKLLSLFSLR